MGAFKIEIVGVGGHGCERKAGPGQKLYGRCGRFNCPDCMAYELVQQMRQKGMLSTDGTVNLVSLGPDDTLPDGAEEVYLNAVPVEGGVKKQRYAKFPHVATFTHWPGSESQVVDDMLTNERKSGSF